MKIDELKRENIDRGIVVTYSASSLLNKDEIKLLIQNLINQKFTLDKITYTVNYGNDKQMELPETDNTNLVVFDRIINKNGVKAYYTKDNYNTILEIKIGVNLFTIIHKLK